MHTPGYKDLRKPLRSQSKVISKMMSEGEMNPKERD